MATQRLPYYRGQYNPYSTSTDYAPDIISMYRPEEEMLLSEAARGRQERFDIAKGAMAQEIARIGDLETLDYEQMTNRLSDFEGKITKTVQDEYNGDYGAAANKIVTMIAKERAHPFYNYNKQKVESAKTYQEDMRRLGANFLSTKDPTRVSFTDWQKGEDFAYTPINKADVVNASAAVFAQMAKTLRDNPQYIGILSNETGQNPQYFEKISKYGFSGPDEVYAFLESPTGSRMAQQLITDMPELAGLDPTVVSGLIAEGAMAGIGQVDIQTLQNRNYISDLDLAKLQGTEGAGGFPRVTLQGYLNADELGKDIQNLNDQLVDSFRQNIMDEMFEDPQYVSLKKEGFDNYNKLTALARRIEPRTQTNLRPSGTGTAYRPTKDETMALSPMQQKALDFKSELDEKLIAAISGSGIDTEAAQKRYGIPIYDFNELAAATTKDISEINNIIDQVNERYLPELKEESTAFLNKRVDKKNFEKMDKETMTIQGFGKNPLGSELVLVVGGDSKDGDKPLEARILIDDRSMKERFINYIGLVDENSDAFRDLVLWHAANYNISLE